MDHEFRKALRALGMPWEPSDMLGKRVCARTTISSAPATGTLIGLSLSADGPSATAHTLNLVVQGLRLDFKGLCEVEAIRVIGHAQLREWRAEFLFTSADVYVPGTIYIP